MTELLNMTQVLGMLRPHGFTPVQRILLCQAGTLQIALSAYFGRPIRLKEIRSAVNIEGSIFSYLV